MKNEKLFFDETPFEINEETEEGICQCYAIAFLSIIGVYVFAFAGIAIFLAWTLR